MESDRLYRWSKIDKIEIYGFPYLSADDICYYLVERLRGSWEMGFANSLVSNFQKDVGRYHDNPDVMAYKSQAIERFARSISSVIARRPRRCPIVIVPMVTSKPKSHPWFDDRLQRVAHWVADHRSGEVVVDDVLDVKEEMMQAKAGGVRDPCILGSNIVVVAPRYPEAETVLLVDDVITTGGHFAACKAIACSLYPAAKVVGLFLARQKNSSFTYGITGY